MAPASGRSGPSEPFEPRPLDTIAEPVRVEQVVTRSRFIATLAPVGDEPAAAAVIREVRRALPDATHHATALVLGTDGQRQRSNDDGEPAGTAGAPMLAVLRGAGLTEVVGVVSREFGGTLLGAGGLVRAYGGTLSAAVDAAVRLERRPVVRLQVTVGHAEAGRLEHRLHGWARGREVEVDPGRYDAGGAVFEVVVPAGDEPELVAALAAGGIDHVVDVVERGLRGRRRPPGR